MHASDTQSGGAPDDGSAPESRVRREPRRRRLFMAGRVDGDVQQVRFAPSTRAPIRGPWSLALVVRAS